MEVAKPLRVVLVGCGNICGAWLGPMKNFGDILIVGLVDLDPVRTQAVKDKHGLTEARCGTDLAAMLNETQPDAVFDCTVPAAHCTVALTALEAGCHVLSEKPMAVSMSEARQMVEASQRAGRLYAVIQNRRYHDAIIRYRKLIDSTAIGELTTLNADFYIAPRFGGFREQMRHVLLHDMAIHSFDQARYIADADARSVYCHEWNPAGSWFSHGASAVAIFEMNNGIVFTYRGSWCAQGLSTSWQCDWRAIGTNGTARWNGDADITCEADTSRDPSTHATEMISIPEIEPLAHQGHAGLICEFADCIREGRMPQTVCTDNIKSLAMVEAAVESAERGCKVDITD